MASSGRPPLDQRLRSNLSKLIELGLHKNGQYRPTGDPELANSFEAKLTTAKLLLPVAPTTMLVERLVKATYPYWDKIRVRNEAVIWLVAQEFPDVKRQIEIIYNYRLANGQRLVSDIDKAKTWVIVQGLVRMCIKFVMANRVTDPGYCAYLDLDRARSQWDITDCQ